MNGQTGEEAREFDHPRGVFVDAAGTIYVADTSNRRICRWDADGRFEGWIGGGQDGWRSDAGTGLGTDFRSFDGVERVALDDGILYVAGRDLNAISRWSVDGIALGWIGEDRDGWHEAPLPAAGGELRSFSSPRGVSIDGGGNVYVADEDDARIVKWTRDGTAVGWIGQGKTG